MGLKVSPILSDTAPTYRPKSTSAKLALDKANTAAPSGSAKCSALPSPVLIASEDASTRVTTPRKRSGSAGLFCARAGVPSPAAVSTATASRRRSTNPSHPSSRVIRPPLRGFAAPVEAHFFVFLAATGPESQVEDRNHEQAEQCGGDEPAEDHDRHRMLDLVAGDASRDDQRHERQRGAQRGHQNRRKALARAAQHELDAEGLSFHALEMAVMLHKQDPVSRRDSEHRDHSDQSTQRNHAVAGEGGERAADQSCRQSEKNQACEPPAPKRRV